MYRNFEYLLYKKYKINVKKFTNNGLKKLFFLLVYSILGFPGGSEGKESTCNAGDLGSI